MRERIALKDHDLNGGANVRRELKRRLDAEKDIEPSRYGVPVAPLDLDADERTEWDALVVELREVLYRDDAKRLAEVARVGVLLAKSFRAAKKGQTVDGRTNPAHGNIEKLMRIREKLLKVFASRTPRPPSSVTGINALETLLAETEKPN